MKKISLVIGCIAIMSLVLAVYGQTTARPAQTAAPTSDAVAAQKAIVTQYLSLIHI